jgi:two-component system OmpR family response regulator
MRVLVVEDDSDLARQLCDCLVDAGYVIDIAPDGEEGHYLGANEPYDAVVLDLGLPVMDGITVLERWRREGRRMPVLILTARDRWSDKVTGIDAGADDYLTKPFDFDELVARIRALMRRTQSVEGAHLRFGGIEMDLASRTVTRDERPIELTSKEFALLEYFMRNPERVLTRTDIGERVWDLLHVDESNVIDVYISRLRRKVDKDFAKPLIHTVIGAGYVLSSNRANCVSAN